jgi:hypothetical protein
VQAEVAPAVAALAPLLGRVSYGAWGALMPTTLEACTLAVNATAMRSLEAIADAVAQASASATTPLECQFNADTFHHIAVVVPLPSAAALAAVGLPAGVPGWDSVPEEATSPLTLTRAYDWVNPATASM